MATIEFFINANNLTDGCGLTRADHGTYWAVSFDGGGSSAPAVDTDSVSFSTSGYTGTLRKVIITSGSWAGSDAAGLLIFEDATRTGSAPIDGETITIGSATATTNISGNAAHFIGSTSADAGAFTGFNACETYLDDISDFTGHNVEIYMSGANGGAGDYISSGELVGTWSPDHTLWQGDTGDADGVVAFNGEGWNTTTSFDKTNFYTMVTDSSGQYGCITARKSNMTFRGIQCTNEEALSPTQLVMYTRYTTLSNVKFENIWSYDNTNGTDYNAPPFAFQGANICTGISVSGCYFKANHTNNYSSLIQLGANHTFDTFCNNIVDASLGSTPYVTGFNFAATVTDFYNNLIVGVTPTNCDNFAITGSGAVTNYGTNAVDHDQGDAQLPIIISTSSNTDIVDYSVPTARDLRPYNGGLLANGGTAAKMSPATDITGQPWTNDNIGCFNEIAGISTAAINKIYNTDYSGISKISGTAVAGISKISGTSV